MALQDDGKIIQAGSLEANNSFTDFAVARSLGSFQDSTKLTGTVTIDEGRRVER